MIFIFLFIYKQRIVASGSDDNLIAIFESEENVWKYFDCEQQCASRTIVFTFWMSK